MRENSMHAHAQWDAFLCTRGHFHEPKTPNHTPLEPSDALPIHELFAARFVKRARLLCRFSRVGKSVACRQFEEGG